MRLSRLKIDGFKNLSAVDWRPAPGLNLVLGPNEAGKSSLAEFIEAMIFGLPGGARGEEYRPWGGGGFGGMLELDCDRARLVIRRDFGTGEFSYEEVNKADGTRSEPLSGQLRRGSGGALAGRYRDMFSRHLGFFDDKLFRRSCYIPQGELVISSRDLEEATTALRSLASGGGSAYDRALERLNERYYALTSECDRRRKPGRLDQLRDEKQDVSARLREAGAHVRRIAQLRRNIEKQREELEGLRAEARSSKATSERLRERTELLHRRSALAGTDRSDRERMDAAENAACEATELKRKLSGLEDLAAATDGFPQVVARARELDERLRRLEEQFESPQEDAPGPYPYVRMLAACAAAILMGGACLAAGLIAGRLVLTICGAAVSSAGLVGAGLLLHFRRRGDAQARTHGEAAARTSSQTEQARNDFKTATAELISQCGGRVEFNAAFMDRLLERHWERRELLSRRAALQPVLLAEQDAEELKSRIADTVRDLAVIDERLERSDAEPGAAGDEGTGTGEASLERSSARSTELTRLVRKREEQIHKLEVELAALTSNETALATAEERLDDLVELISGFETRCCALRLARAELNASIQEFQESHLERLAVTSGEILGGLTGQRYRGVKLDPETLAPSVATPEREGIPEGLLSRGTCSALFLALRLAMGKLVSGGRALPLILDDPMVDLDTERRAASLKMLRELAEDSQVLLLSFDRRLLECGTTVLELEGQ